MGEVHGLSKRVGAHLSLKRRPSFGGEKWRQPLSRGSGHDYWESGDGGRVSVKVAYYALGGDG
jgi:hypothetical protein